MLPVSSLTPILPASDTVMHWSSLAAGSLLSATWEGLVLAAAVGLCLRALPEISPTVRSLVWTMVFAAVALLHFGSIGHAGSLHAAHTSGHGRALQGLRVNPRWSLAAVGLWVLAGLARGVQLAASATRLRAIALRAIPIDGMEVAELGAIRFLGRFQRAAVLCTSPDVDRPCVLGFMKPRILLPESLLSELSAPELEQVVLHEMEHLRRGDDWTNLLQKLTLVVFPLNPVLVWVERRLCLERELACDDGVLRSTSAPKAYAMCLAKLAEHAMMLREASSLALGALGAALERRSELVRRVHRILASSQQVLMGRRQTAAVTTLLAAGLLSGAIGLEHAPQLVRFAPASVGTAADTASSMALSGNELWRSAQHGPEMRQTMAQFPSEARPQLVSAIMPERDLRTASMKNVSSATRKPKMMRAVAAKTVAQSRRYSLRQTSLQLQSQPGLPAGVAAGSWLVLTSWQESEPAAAMLVAVPQQVSHTYAAVRVPDGWLIVSL